MREKPGFVPGFFVSGDRILNKNNFDATGEILFCGDPHGRFEHINRTARERKPAAMVLLGDYDLQEPLDVVLEEAARHTEIWWIAGNHDFDSAINHDCLLTSANRLLERNLHGRVVEVAGLRIAGLGGTFIGTIWDPRLADQPNQPAQPRYETREVAANPPSFRDGGSKENNDRRNRLRGLRGNNVFRGGLPLKEIGAIWPEDYYALAAQRADVLITHEAPGCHPHGYPELDDLARAMGAQLIVHGHHHVGYTLPYARGDLTAHGVGKQGISDLEGGVVVPDLYGQRAVAHLHQSRATSLRPLADLQP